MKSFKRWNSFLSLDTNKALQTSYKNFDRPENRDVGFCLLFIIIGFEYKGKISKYANQ